MQGICIDTENNKIIYATPVIRKKTLDKNFINIDIKYRRLVKIFYQALEENIDYDYLKAFFYNINNVKIKKDILTGAFYDIVKDGTCASYDVIKNKIILYCEELNNIDFYHELLHLSSSIQDHKNKIYYCGFSQDDKYSSVGTAINEGYTEYLCSDIFGIDNDSYYEYEMLIIKLLEMIIGKDNMQKLYFNADLYNLINSLTNLNTIPRIKKFLYKTDYILDKRNSTNNKTNEKVIKYMLDVNFFLIETYRNQLLKQYREEKISINELFYLYKQFIEIMNILLDIDLPINKDILRLNIRDNDFIHMNKVKKLI